MSSFDWKKNVHNHRNIFRIKSSKRKATKDISECHGYHKTCRWNMWSGAGEGLCSLQKMDQRVMQQKFYGPIRAIKLHVTKCRSILGGAPLWRVLPTHVYTVLLFNG